MFVEQESKVLSVEYILHIHLELEWWEWFLRRTNFFYFTAVEGLKL